VDDESIQEDMKARRFITMFVCTLVLYVLSVGPVVFCGQAIDPGPHPRTALGRTGVFVYGPLLWLSNQWKPLSDGLNWYIVQWSN